MASILPLSHTLVSRVETTWTDVQEKSLNREYPFQDLRNESDDHFVARTYLQFLWLPESIMPLRLLVSSLLRVRSGNASDSASTTSALHSYPHPLHDLLEPLLLTTRAASNKYHTELPQILSDGGGAGEMEETMMWFAINYEKGPGDDNSGDKTRSKDAQHHFEGPWMDESWRKAWLERLERREVQVQILLHLLKLSLPGPAPLPPRPIAPLDPSGSSPRKRRRRAKEPQALIPSVEDRLETFMDKLSMWQLISGLDRRDGDVSKDSRDWMQSFCEDVVEPEFKANLPEECALLRSKVFPVSAFSDDESHSSSRPASPDIKGPRESRKKLARSATLKSVTTTTTSGRLNATATSGETVRSRSRSLSVSLAEDADARRASSVGATSRNKRVLNREVSMSRVFKAKPPKEKNDKGNGQVTIGSGLIKSLSHSWHKNSAVPPLPKAQKSTSAPRAVTLVEATPVKKIKGVSKDFQKERNPSGMSFPITQEVYMDIGANAHAGGEEVWEIPSSPDILLLGETGVGISDEEEDEEASLGSGTPTRKGRRIE